ncbi:MAG: sensor histidine kinase KdpD [Anaerolineae bacterium]|nr:sensor histidine kinase KdpD [Anaerolineae bacterium]
MQEPRSDERRLGRFQQVIVFVFGMGAGELSVDDVTVEEPSRRGKLKVFLGYAVGVGKTLAMLQAAQRRKDEGVDVVVAFIETHSSLETSLEAIPPRGVEPRVGDPRTGRGCGEMDVESILKRRPHLVLVDDLSHTNSPGSRHARRYQDVEDLLSAGIDVYVTLSVQHLQSLCDIVAQITGVTIPETLPDRILDQAGEIELIDLSPEVLLRRFQEGRVCVPGWMAEQATQFFRLGNLIALRELAMRRAARWVDERMRAYMQSRAIAGPWAVAERLLACVGADPSGEQVVRATRRLADQLNAEWFALHVETIRDARLSEAQKDRLARTLRLAEELGVRVVSLPGLSVVEASVSYARAHNITRIVVGRSPRNWWQNLVGGGVAGRMIRVAQSIDVHVVVGTAQDSFSVESSSRRSPNGGRWSFRPWRNYVLSLGLVAGASLLSALVQPYLSPANLAMIYLLCVVVAAIYLGRGPAIATSFTGVLALDFFFVPPAFTLAVADTEYLLTFLGLLGVGLVISNLAAQVRNQVENAQRREVEMATLYALSRDLSAAEGLESIVQAIVDNVGQTFDRQVAVLLSASGSGVDLEAHQQSADFARDRSQVEAAGWVFRHERPAGRGTDTFSDSQAYYLPLKTARGMIGVLGVRPMQPDRLLSPEQRRLLEALSNQAALAIERAQLAEVAQRAQLLAATEKLQSALLNSVSHDLRTPLVSITGVLSSLEDEEAPLKPQTRRALIETAREEAERLNQLVGNLLNMTRIEAGAVHITWELEDVQDAIGSTLEQLRSRVEGRQIRVEVPLDLPFVPMDFVLIVQVLVNLVDNALKYSPPDKPIEIRAWMAEGEIAIQVADRGIGIPSEDLDRVFDKFYRVRRPDNVMGTGLGLSISKGLVEAHGGRIWAENRSGGGAAFTLILPVERRDG